MLRSRSTELSVPVLAMCFLWLAPAHAMAQEHGALYAAVTDQNGAPVLDLTTDDFELTMDGNVLTLASAELDAAPKIALLVDNGSAMADANSPLRSGLEAFLDTLAPQHTVGIFTIGGQVRRREDFTTERDKLKDTAAGVFVDSGAGAKLMEGLQETWDRRFEDEDPWPVFALVLGDGADASSFMSEDEYREFVTELRVRQATVHAVVLLGGIGGSVFQIASNLAELTGGRFLTINSASGLPESLTELAGQLNDHAAQASTRYRIVYEIPDDPGNGELSMRLRRQGLGLALFANRAFAQ